MDRQQANCNVLAAYLHTLGFPVHYPGLKTDPGHTLHFSQATGAGAVMSFETADVDLSSRIVAGTSIFGISVSFGAVNSLISMPCLMRSVPLLLFLVYRLSELSKPDLSNALFAFGLRPATLRSLPTCEPNEACPST